LLRGEQDATRDTLQVSKNEVSWVQGDLAIAKEQAKHMMNMFVVLRTWVETL
jgi:hypothetical protein